MQANVEVEEYGVVVGSVKSSVDPPGGDGTMETVSKSHVDTGVPEGCLECRSVIDVLDV